MSQHEDEATERFLDESLASVRSMREPCPDSSSLLEFHRNQLEPAAAQVIRNHIAICGECDLFVERSRPVRKPAWWVTRGQWLRSPVPGYALALLLAFPAYRGFTSPPLVAGAPAISSIPVVELDTTRGGGRVAALATAESQVLLLFQLPVRPGKKYVASLTVEGRVAGTANVESWDGLGNFCVLIDRRQLAAGTYHLSVKEAPPASETQQSFDFDFSL